MIDLIRASNEILQGFDFQSGGLDFGKEHAMFFEDPVILGFLFAFPSASALISDWEAMTNRAIASFQFGLRLSGQKAWNTYLILLTSGPVDQSKKASLAAIEEDLTGTRKIARAGIRDVADVRAALLPILPLQSSPKLEAVDIRSEIRRRTTELPSRAIDAFFSDSDEAAVLPVLESAP